MKDMVVEKKSKKTELNWGILSKYRNVLYGLACISIMLFHYACYVPYDNSVKAITAYVFKAVIGSIGVEIFILMSGICMYFSFYRKQNVMEFYIKRFRRLIIPYILVVVPFYVHKDIFMNRLGREKLLSDLSYESFFLEGNISVWYILCIAIMYLLYPVLFKAFEKYDKYRHALLGIFLGASIASNLVLYVVAPELFTKIEIMTMRFPIYIIGVYLGKKVYEKQRFSAFEIILFIIGAVTKFIIDFLKYHEMIIIPIFVIRYVNLNSSLVLLGSVVLLLAIFKFNSKNKLLCKCGALSLELYLVHVTLMNILVCYGYPIDRYSYFACYLMITIATSIFVNNITDLIEITFLKVSRKLKTYNTCEWKLKQLYKQNTGKTFKGAIKLRECNSNMYVPILEEIYNKLLYDIGNDETSLLEYANDIKYVKSVVKNHSGFSDDVNDVVAIYLANMTDEYFMRMYRRYFCKTSN